MDTSPIDKQNSTPHTPGPWRNDAPGSLLVVVGEGKDERIVAGCWGHSDELLPEGIANARLIAAAPSMYDELSWAVDWLDRFEGQCMPEWREWQERARAALVLARGGSNASS